jgi:uncharacterized protein YndB with AHSA1/START domain
VTRTFDAPAHTVFQAWSGPGPGLVRARSRPEIFQRWWMPKATGMTIVAWEMDVGTGGGKRGIAAVRVPDHGNVVQVDHPGKRGSAPVAHNRWFG